MQHHYSVYGVSLTSDIPFDFPPSCERSEGRPRVRFAMGGDAEFAASPSADVRGEWFVCRELANGSMYLRWSGLFEFVIDPAGTVVTYRALRDGDPAVLQNFLFGQALSFALIRQNVEPVHAAVVDVGGAAIALLGDCTYGKSTLAAALLRTGCRLVSDDLLVVHESGGSAFARAGAGRIKLLPDSASALLGDPGDGVRLIPQAEKRMFRLARHLVQPDDVALRAFVVLPEPEERDASDRVEISRIPGPELFRELVKNTFVRYVDEGPRLHQNFSWNTHLASTISGYRVRYPPGLERLPSIADAITTHFRRH